MHAAEQVLLHFEPGELRRRARLGELALNLQGITQLLRRDADTMQAIGEIDAAGAIDGGLQIGRHAVRPTRWIMRSDSSRKAFSWPPATGEILIERDAFQVAKAKIGDKVTVKTANGWFGFPNGFMEKQLGVVATTRQWSTIKKFVAFTEKG